MIIDKPIIRTVLIISIFSFLNNIPAQDWANLVKYQRANKELAEPKENENRVVFMGNSITVGWLQANPSFFENKAYINRGIGGQTTPQMLLRFRQDVIALNPKIVVILAGTNDIAENTGPITLEQICDYLLSMVDLAKGNEITPILCSVLPAYDYPWRPGKAPNIKIPKLNGMIKEMCKTQGIRYLDYFSAMSDNRNGLPKAYTTDEVHLTKAGYAVMEGLVEKAIEEILEN